MIDQHWYVAINGTALMVYANASKRRGATGWTVISIMHMEMTYSEAAMEVTWLRWPSLLKPNPMRA